MREGRNELGKVGVQPHIAVFGLEYIRELVESLALRELAVDRVVLFAVWETKEKVPANVLVRVVRPSASVGAY
jgi:hypothetical protein